MHLVVDTSPMRWLLVVTLYKSEPLREVEDFFSRFGFVMFYRRDFATAKSLDLVKNSETPFVRMNWRNV
jgi:hypothetical protein